MSTCDTPPSLTNGKPTSVSNTTAEFQCSSGFKMSGSPVVSCDSTSGWGPLPSCAVIETKNTFYASFAPEWLLILLGVLFSLLTLACIAGLVWYCCCKP
ncbi:hypothetical protein SNE40_014497 [Patella caerulea]|uniref:Sushi domain-containing protein n=1 Tax=Patella caerulea TaxID=87958 RepID=A0AAN8JIF3_PATCE